MLDVSFKLVLFFMLLYTDPVAGVPLEYEYSGHLLWYGSIIQPALVKGQVPLQQWLACFTSIIMIYQVHVSML